MIKKILLRDAFQKHYFYNLAFSCTCCVSLLNNGYCIYCYAIQALGSFGKKSMTRVMITEDEIVKNAWNEDDDNQNEQSMSKLY